MNWRPYGQLEVFGNLRLELSVNIGSILGGQPCIDLYDLKLLQCLHSGGDWNWIRKTWDIHHGEIACAPPLARLKPRTSH